jgi:alkanesulfonate monooxygenase SsuD/methylene tetrahydromethanopterin reductase-like flavin-dependent oxidoreductase (luciferase family)
MKIGLGLPVDDPAVLLDWALRADAGPFSTLGLLDRMAWPNPEPLVTLAVLAGATRRIRLQTEVLLVPLRETTLLAKQTATLDRLSGGRFTLGVGIGGRDDDSLAAGVPTSGRGAQMDRKRGDLQRIWAGGEVVPGSGPVGPAPLRPEGPEMLIGAFRPAALARVARFGAGFLCAAPPSWAGGLIETVDRQWAEAGRPGRPRHVGQINVGIAGSGTGRDDADAARTAMTRYYGDLAERMVAGLLTSRAQVRAAISAYADLGADEVVLYCWSTSPDQVDRLADLVD